MKLTLRRTTFTPQSTIGTLWLDGIFQCYTLEDAVHDGDKIPGQTAIPPGLYKVVLNWSPRFRTIMPLLLSVPNFTGVRIHWGNYPKDTEGCILVGTVRGDDFVGNSRFAYSQLMEKLKTADSIELEVINVVEPS